MEDVVVKVLEMPDLKNTVLVEGLPGIGLVGKLAADHLLDELRAKKFVELYSPYLPPQVNILDDGTVKLVNMELHYHRTKKKDLVLLVGDFQGITPDSQYQLSEKILDIAEQCNVKKIYTLGGLGTGSIVHNPKVYGAASSTKVVKELEKHGVIFRGGGAIFGASGLLLGMGMQRDMEAVCLMGETHGQIIDAKSAEAVLDVLAEILGIKVDMSELVEKAKETEEQMNKIQTMISAHRKAEEDHQKFLDESPSYIR